MKSDDEDEDHEDEDDDNEDDKVALPLLCLFFSLHHLDEYDSLRMPISL